jgi:uncharacterized OB-fold protein
MSIYSDFSEPQPFDEDYDVCKKCGNVYHISQDFCYVCLSDEDRLRLGVL